MVECISKACSFAPIFCSSVSMLCCWQVAIATDVFAITETSSQLNARDSFLGAQEFLFGGTGSPFLEDTLFGCQDPLAIARHTVGLMGISSKSWSYSSRQQSQIMANVQNMSRERPGGKPGSPEEKKGLLGPLGPISSISAPWLSTWAFPGTPGSPSHCLFLAVQLI